MRLPAREFSATAVGADSADMRAALQISQGGQTYTLPSKAFPARSHIVSTQDGIIIVLGSTHKNNWGWRMYDTVEGSDCIGNRDAIEYMCETGSKAVLELEHMGLPFSCLDDGHIYQRPFDGQSKNFGGEQAARITAAIDHTGHVLLYTLYQQNLKSHTTIFSEWYALDLVRNQDGAVVGCTALCIEAGEVVYSKARVTVLAAGGARRIYQSTINTHINAGDGVGMAIRAGVPVQNMEMRQLHPAGIASAGVLVTGGCHGEDGCLLDKRGERFVEHYVPNAEDPVGHDVAARPIVIEIHEGYGCNGPWGPHTELKLGRLGREVLEPRLPDTLELSRASAHVDLVKELIPVIPTCRYMVDGIPTKVTDQALTVNEKDEGMAVPRLSAAGEIACISVHGANRLGGNSLSDLVVFDHAAGLRLQESVAEQGALCNASEPDVEMSLDHPDHWNSNRNGEGPVAIRKVLQECVQYNFSVFREGNAMAKGPKQLKVIHERLKNTCLDDTSSKFNAQHVEYLELGNLVETAYATATSASFHIEGRSAHSRFDFPDRDNENWSCHSLYLPGLEPMTHRSVSMEPRLHPTFPPKVRIY